MGVRRADIVDDNMYTELNRGIGLLMIGTSRVEKFVASRKGVVTVSYMMGIWVSNWDAMWEIITG